MVPEPAAPVFAPSTKVSVAPSVELMMRLPYLVAKPVMVCVSASPSPSPVKMTVEPGELVKGPLKLLVLVPVFVWMVPLFVKSFLTFAANVPVPIVMVPLLVRL